MTAKEIKKRINEDYGSKRMIKKQAKRIFNHIINYIESSKDYYDFIEIKKRYITKNIKYKFYQLLEGVSFSNKNFGDVREVALGMAEDIFDLVLPEILFSKSISYLNTEEYADLYYKTNKFIVKIFKEINNTVEYLILSGTIEFRI